MKSAGTLIRPDLNNCGVTLPQDVLTLLGGKSKVLLDRVGIHRTDGHRLFLLVCLAHCLTLD